MKIFIFLIFLLLSINIANADINNGGFVGGYSSWTANGIGIRDSNLYSNGYHASITNYTSGSYDNSSYVLLSEATDIWSTEGTYSITHDLFLNQSVDITGYNQLKFRAKVVTNYGITGKVVTVSNKTITLSNTSWDEYTLNLTGLSGVQNISVYLTSYSSSATTDNDYVSVGVDNFYLVSSVVSPVASFTGTPTSGNSPLSVSFTDTSTNTPTSWYWDFGDGHTSTAQNPTNIYSAAGTYTVKHSATNAGGTSWSNVTNYITTNAPITAAFTADQTSISAGTTVHFTDQSSGNGLNTWAWDINGDGITDYTTQNPSVTYQTPGTYSVSLTASSSSTGSSNSITKTGYIRVSNSADCNFKANVTFGNVPLSVLFNDTSLQNANSWTWSVNGVQQAITQNLTIVFNNAGIYTIGHTATGPAGTGSLIKTNYIQVYPASYGGIYGYISDASTNQPLSGVSCQLSNNSASASIVSDSTGYYYFWPVYNGVYNLTVTKNGYVTGSLPNTIINGTTLIQNISLTASGDQMGQMNITNYSSNWLTFSLNSNTANKTIVLNYAVTNGSTSYANLTIYSNNGPVYTSNLSTQTGSFFYTGTAGNNYLVSFDVMNNQGEHYSGAYPIIFFRGLPTNYSPFPADYPDWLKNELIIFLVIVCFLFFGKAFIEIGLFLGTSVLAASYIWGFLNLPSNVQVPVIIALSALIAGGEYIAKRKILGS